MEVTPARGLRPASLRLAGLLFCFLTALAQADTITASAAGQFGAGVTADQLTASGGLWAFSFDLDSNPTAANTDAFSFDAPFSGFSYLLNGSAIAVSPDSIRFFTSDDGGLFTLFFGPETGFLNGIPIPEFSFSGAQVFSGTPASPTISPGSYSISDALYSDAINFDDEGASGTVFLTTTPAPVPEPSALWLCATGGAWVMVLRRKSRKECAPEPHSARPLSIDYLTRMGCD
jgi:hypothetical protein